MFPTSDFVSGTSTAIKLLPQISIEITLSKCQLSAYGEQSTRQGKRYASLLSVRGLILSLQVCCHVHGVFPYCYIEYTGNLTPDEGKLIRSSRILTLSQSMPTFKNYMQVSIYLWLSHTDEILMILIATATSLELRCVRVSQCMDFTLGGSSI